MMMSEERLKGLLIVKLMKLEDIWLRSLYWHNWLSIILPDKVRDQALTVMAVWSELVVCHLASNNGITIDCQ